MLIKVHVPGRDDAVGDRVIATVAFGVRRVTEKYTRDGARGEFMRGGGGEYDVVESVNVFVFLDRKSVV